MVLKSPGAIPYRKFGVRVWKNLAQVVEMEPAARQNQWQGERGSGASVAAWEMSLEATVIPYIDGRRQQGPDPAHRRLLLRQGRFEVICDENQGDFAWRPPRRSFRCSCLPLCSVVCSACWRGRTDENAAFCAQIGRSASTEGTHEACQDIRFAEKCRARGR